MGGNGDAGDRRQVGPSAIAPAWMLELQQLVLEGKARPPGVERLMLMCEGLPVAGAAPGHAHVLIGLSGDLDAEWRFSRIPLATLFSLLAQASNQAGVVKAIEMTSRPRLER